MRWKMCWPTWLWESFCHIYTYEIIMLYNLNLHRVLSQKRWGQTGGRHEGPCCPMGDSWYLIALKTRIQSGGLQMPPTLVVPPYSQHSLSLLLLIHFYSLGIYSTSSQWERNCLSWLVSIQYERPFLAGVSGLPESNQLWPRQQDQITWSLTTYA